MLFNAMDKSLHQGVWQFEQAGRFRILIWLKTPRGNVQIRSFARKGPQWPMKW
jgi:hypothetical protein